MGWEAAGRRTDTGENAATSEIKVTLTIAVDGEGKLDTDNLEAAFTVNGELPRAFAGITAGARAQLAEIIGRVKAAGAASGGAVRRSRFTAEIPDFTRGFLAPRTPEKAGDRPPDRAAVRREFNERQFVQAVMDLPVDKRRQLKAEYVRLLNSGSLPGAGLLAEEQRRTGFSDPAVQSAFRNFLWGKLLLAGPEQEAAYAAYYNEKKWAWVDGKDLDQGTEPPQGGWQPSARGLAPEQEAKLVQRWLAGAE